MNYLTYLSVWNTKALLIPSEVYKGITNISAPLANRTNELMASRFFDVMRLIDQIMRKSFDKRLATFLLSEMNIRSSNILKTTHEETGNRPGYPRKAVTRMLKHFASEDTVKLSLKTIESVDENKLAGIEER